MMIEFVFFFGKGENLGWDGSVACAHESEILRQRVKVITSLSLFVRP